MKFINTTNRRIPLNGMKARQPNEIRDITEQRMEMTLFRSREIMLYAEYQEQEKLLTPNPSPSEKGEKTHKAIKTT